MTTLPADAHVHSEWSWDSGSDPALPDSKVRICERAVRMGLPAVVFTEHLDFEDARRVDDVDIGEHAQKYVDGTSHVRLPLFDADGYDAIQAVRSRPGTARARPQTSRGSFSTAMCCSANGLSSRSPTGCVFFGRTASRSSRCS